MACLLFSWSIILSCRSHVVLGCGIHFHTPCMALGAGRASPACVNDQVKAVIPGARRRFVQKARGSYATVRTSLLLFVCRFEDAPVVPPCVGLRVYCSSEAKPPKGWNACKFKKKIYIAPALNTRSILFPCTWVRIVGAEVFFSCCQPARAMSPHLRAHQREYV